MPSHLLRLKTICGRKPSALPALHSARRDWNALGERCACLLSIVNRHFFSTTGKMGARSRCGKGPNRYKQRLFGLSHPLRWARSCPTVPRVRQGRGASQRRWFSNVADRAALHALACKVQNCPLHRNTSSGMPLGIAETEGTSEGLVGASGKPLPLTNNSSLEEHIPSKCKETATPFD